MQDKINKFFSIIKNSKNFAYDVETNGLSWLKCHVCGYSVSDGKDAVYIPVRHALDHSPDSNIGGVGLFELELNKAVQKHPGKIIGHHIKFDSHFSENHSIKLGNKLKDTMVRESLINENKHSYSLAATTASYDIPQKKGKELYEHIAQMVGCKPTQKDAMGHFHRLRGDDPIAVEYAEYDTLSTMNLYNEQEKEIYGQELEVVEGLESELIHVLQKMERTGILIDLEEYEGVKKTIEEMHIDAYSFIPIMPDGPINVRSNKDLQEYFDLCEIDGWEFTQPTNRFPDGQPSFNKDWLAGTDEGILILNARKFDHLIDSFITPFESLIYNNKIHTNFNQTGGEFGGTKSGRLSSTRPNLQQVPKRDKQLGKIFRRVFIPKIGFIFVEYDHSQAEPRLYAHYSREPCLLDGYSQIPFVDMHTIAANMMSIERERAKSLNLGILYTMGAYKLSKQLRIPIEQARAIIKRWYQTFREVGNFTYRASDVAKTRGYVRTILGRRARFSDPRFCYRAANRIIQGSSADILKWKMVEINRWIEKNNYDEVVQMILNIHDALLFQIHKDYLHLIPEIGKMFAAVQEAPFNLRVPFHADYHVGANWSEASYGI